MGSIPSIRTGDAKPRLAYIDWARGLACLLMFQTHCYDAWLNPEARRTDFFMYSQLGGTFPAPLFLFLAGVSFAMVTDKLRQKNLPAAEIARSTIWRGAEIFGFGLLFRLQEYLVAWGWAPASDLLKVDVLNTIGLSMMLLGVLCWAVLGFRRGPGSRIALVLAACATALTISLLSPPLWTTWRPHWLPWPLESYIDGVHNLGVPQQGIFPVFPWTGFAFAGLALGFLLHSEWVEKKQAAFFAVLLAAGVALIAFSRWLDRQPERLYAVDDYWHTSPSFFLIRVGMLLLILVGAYAWCRWGAGQWGFSPLIVLGQASLLVYWVHLEFVYGRVSILHKRVQSIGMASVGLAIIFLAMLGLAYWRTRMKKKTGTWPGWWKTNPARAN